MTDDKSELREKIADLDVRLYKYKIGDDLAHKIDELCTEHSKQSECGGVLWTENVFTGNPPAGFPSWQDFLGDCDKNKCYHLMEIKAQFPSPPKPIEGDECTD